MKIAVFGAGAWGTALAVNAAARHELVLWARDAVQADTIRRDRENRRYLPGVKLPSAIDVSSNADVAHIARACDLAVIATPMAGLREMLAALAAQSHPVAWLCKGFESTGTEGLLGHEVLAQAAPRLPAGVLSGPSFAEEVAHGRPTALV